MTEELKTETDKETEAGLMQEPMHVLRKMVSERGMKWIPRDKKVDLVKMLADGKELDRKKKPIKVLENKSSGPVSKAVIPDAVIARAAEMSVQYEIDEATCSVTFKGRVPICCTLDQPEQNIMAALNQTRGGKMPIERADTRDAFF